MFRRRGTRSAGEASSASMSDIAFLLLIFFLVTTIFAVEKGIPMILPGDRPAKKVSRKDLVTIQLHANGTITIDGRPVSLPQIRHDIGEQLAGNEKLVMVIESHPDSEYGLMVDVLDELRLAKANRITLREMRVSNRNQ